MAVAIVAIPRDDDYVWRLSSEKIPHMTLLFLGDNVSGADLTHIETYIDHAVDSSLCKFTLNVDYRGELGPDDADVLFFKKDDCLDGIKAFRTNLLRDDDIKKFYEEADQFPQWTPHLTMGYPTAPAKEDDREYPGIGWVCFDKIALWTDDFNGPEFRIPDEGNAYSDVAYSDNSGASLSHDVSVSEKPWSDYSSSDYSLEQYAAACLISPPKADLTSKAQCKLPVKTPDGVLNRAGVHAAAGALSGARGGVKLSADERTTAVNQLLKMYGQLDEKPPPSLKHSELLSNFLSSHATTSINALRHIAMPGGGNIEIAKPVAPSSSKGGNKNFDESKVKRDEFGKFSTHAGGVNPKDKEWLKPAAVKALTQQLLFNYGDEINPAIADVVKKYGLASRDDIKSDKKASAEVLTRVSTILNNKTSTYDPLLTIATTSPSGELHLQFSPNADNTNIVPKVVPTKKLSHEDSLMLDNFLSSHATTSINVLQHIAMPGGGNIDLAKLVAPSSHGGGNKNFDETNVKRDGRGRFSNKASSANKTEKVQAKYDALRDKQRVEQAKIFGADALTMTPTDWLSSLPKSEREAAKTKFLSVVKRQLDEITAFEKEHPNVQINLRHSDMLGNFLAHHGVKGMKWGVRRTDAQLAAAPSGKSSHISRLKATVNKLRGKSGGGGSGGEKDEDGNEIHISADAQRFAHTIQKKGYEMSDREIKEANSRILAVQQYNKLLNDPNAELRARVESLNLQKQYSQLNSELNPSKVSRVRSLVKEAQKGFDDYNQLNKATNGLLGDMVYDAVGLRGTRPRHSKFGGKHRK